jgi:hypothetical protein
MADPHGREYDGASRADPPLGGDFDADDWVPLSVAADRLAVSVSALRKAFRQGRIVSRIVHGPHGPQRLVQMSEVSSVIGVRRRRDTELEGQNGTSAGVDAVALGDEAVVVPRAEWQALLDDVASIRDALEQVLDDNSLIGEVLAEHLELHAGPPQTSPNGGQGRSASVGVEPSEGHRGNGFTASELSSLTDSADDESRPRSGRHRRWGFGHHSDSD